MIKAIHRLCEMFLPHCSDDETIRELIELCRAVENQHFGRCREAKPLFNRIRDKTLSTEKTGDKQAEVQYLFEEICAKSIYNLSFHPGGFDPDSPFYIIPIALEFGRKVGVSDAQVMKLATEQDSPSLAGAD